MSSKMAMTHHAALSNTRRSRVRRLGRVHAGTLWAQMQPRSALILGGDASERAQAACSMVRSMADRGALPVLVLTRAGSPLASQMRRTLCSTQIGPACRYNYLNGLQPESIHTMLTALAAGQAAARPEETSAWCRAFIKAVNVSNPVHLASMSMLARQSDPQIAAFAEAALLQADDVSVLKSYSGQIVRALLSDLEAKLPYAGFGADDEPNLVTLALSCFDTGRSQALLLDCFSASQRLVNACLAAELEEMTRLMLPFAVVLDAVPMDGEEDPLLAVLPALQGCPSAHVIFSAPSPAAVPGGMQSLRGFSTKLLLPHGQIADMLQSVLDTYGKYTHADVVASTNREPFSLPFDRHDGYAIAYAERPVLTAADCCGCDAIVSGFIRRQLHVMLINRLD